MPQSINMLTNVQTAEVSLVRRGANNKRFAITKENPNMKLADLIKKVLETEAEGEAELVTTLKAAGADEETMEVAVANFRLQSGFADKLSTDELATVAKAAGFDLAKAKKGEHDDDDDDGKPFPGAKPPFKGKKKKTAKGHVPADMPVEVQKAFDDQATEMEVVRKEAAEAQAEVSKLRKEGELKDFIAKCADKYSHVPGQSIEEMGTMLQEAYEVSKDFGAKLEDQWEKTNESLKKSSLLTKQGIVHSTQDGPTDMGKMEAVAKELKAKDPGLSYSDALAKAMDMNPDHYAEYLADNPAQTGNR